MVNGPSNAFDLGALSALKADARRDSDGNLEAVAEQFESLFARMMLKSMRAASFGDPIFGGQQNEFYRDMFDDQMAVELAKGRGLGIADMLVRQLGGENRPVENPANLAPINRTRAVDEQPARTPEEFMEDIWPHADRIGRQLGVDPQAIVAQAALETGWGNKGIRAADGRDSHNLFGIKAGRSWAGESAAVSTLEYTGSGLERRTEAFRVYEDLDAGMQGYAKFLGGSGRYQEALAQGEDPVAYVRALADAGYATDPEYADKLEAIMASDRFQSGVARLRGPQGADT